MIDQIVTIIIHIFIFGFRGNRFYQMKEKMICYIMVYGCYGCFYSLEFVQFLKIRTI